MNYKEKLQELTKDKKPSHLKEGKLIEINVRDYENKKIYSRKTASVTTDDIKKAVDFMSSRYDNSLYVDDEFFNRSNISTKVIEAIRKVSNLNVIENGTLKINIRDLPKEKWNIIHILSLGGEISARFGLLQIFQITDEEFVIDSLNKIAAEKEKE